MISPSRFQPTTEGAGRKSDPFRYWLPNMEEKWQTDPLYAFYQSDREAQRLIAEMGVPAARSA